MMRQSHAVTSRQTTSLSRLLQPQQQLAYLLMVVVMTLSSLLMMVAVVVHGKDNNSLSNRPIHALVTKLSSSSSLAFVPTANRQHHVASSSSLSSSSKTTSKFSLPLRFMSTTTTTRATTTSSWTQLNMAATTGAGGSYKKIFVAGGSRGVGRYLIDKLLAVEGVEEVVALVRTESAIQALQQEVSSSATSSKATLRVVQGDAMDYKTVENAMDGCQAAITTLGGGTVLENPSEQRIDYQGNNNVIEAAGILGVTRVILVTSIGCGSSKAAAPPSVFDVLKEVLAAKERAENVLIKYYTNMNWTILRPGGLKTEPATGRAILTEDTTAIGSIHREDVANLIVQALYSPKTERKILSALDPTLTSAVNLDGRNVEAFVLA